MILTQLCVNLVAATTNTLVLLLIVHTINVAIKHCNFYESEYKN